MDPRMEVELRTANLRLIEMAVYMARHDPEPMSGLIGSLREEWIGVDGEASMLIAGRPCLLVDFRFDDAGWWQRLKAGEEMVAAPWASRFPRQTAVELAQQVLTLAWHLAGNRVLKASIRLGLSVRVAEVVSQIRFEELVRIAEVHVGVMRLRWEAGGMFWKQLLAAARRGDLKALRDSDLHGAQMLVRDLVKHV